MPNCCEPALRDFGFLEHKDAKGKKGSECTRSASQALSARVQAQARNARAGPGLVRNCCTSQMQTYAQLLWSGAATWVCQFTHVAATSQMTVRTEKHLYRDIVWLCEHWTGSSCPSGRRVCEHQRSESLSITRRDATRRRVVSRRVMITRFS